MKTKPPLPKRPPAKKKHSPKKKHPSKKRPPTRRQARAPKPGTDQHSERLQKLLARAGLGSRRALEQRIAAGEVKINGRQAGLGDSAGDGDRIELNRKEYRVTNARLTARTLVYHKPVGQVTTRDDPQGRATVFDKLPRLRGARWIAVGRLDLNTSGLLLLTTDGELANQMMHPSGNVDREYVCRIRGPVSDEQLEKLVSGVKLEDGLARFSDIVAGEVTAGHCWYTVAIMEGRNREVRRLWEAVGATVAQLKRVRFGPVFLPANLRAGQFRDLKTQDHHVLRQDVGLKRDTSHLTLKRI